MHKNKNNKNDHESRFLEAPLLRQAEGELKNLNHFLPMKTLKKNWPQKLHTLAFSFSTAQISPICPDN